MDKSTIEAVMDYLTQRRMSSVGNVAMRFRCSVSKLLPVVKMLEAGQRLRLAIPRCGGACSSCDDCKPEPRDQILTESTILISLERKEELI